VRGFDIFGANSAGTRTTLNILIGTVNSVAKNHPVLPFVSGSFVLAPLKSQNEPYGQHYQ
jgi:hypothetical protein